MSSLITLRARVLELLSDSGGAAFTADLIDESLLRAVDEYSQVNPQQGETLLELPGDGWEIALNGIDGLLTVLAVHWPYDSTLDEDEQHENMVSHFFLWWDIGMPVMTVVTSDLSQPLTDDEMRVWYTAAQTIDGLGLGSYTSVPEMHESVLVVGAAGFAAMSKSAEMMISTTADMYGATLTATWGRAKEREFRQLLTKLATVANQSGPQRSAQKLDKWDRVY